MQKKARVSIKEIARIVGVSHSTVSRALNDSPLVNKDTKDRIRHTAQEMGYSPNAIARSLVTRQSMTVGLVVTSIADPFVAEVVHGIEETAQDNSYNVILSSAGTEPEREFAAVSLLSEKRVDAIIVTSSRVGALYLDRLEGIGVPVVLINNHNEQSGRYTYTVTVDNRHGGYIAARHLLELGHGRIAYVTGSASHSSDHDRMSGYIDALSDYGVEFSPGLVSRGTGKAPGGEKALEELLRAGEDFTAVFCYNDMTAIGLMRAAREKGIKMPGDLAVVGFDDIPFASYVSPPLTTVAQPKMEMGKEAMKMALELIKRGALGEEEGAVSLTDVVMKGHLVVRETCGAKALTRAKERAK